VYTGGVTKKQLKLISSVLGVILLAAGYFIQQQHASLNTATQTVQQHNPGLYTVVRFVDGDTIAVNMNGKVETVRFIGVDTPETHKPNSPVQCYGVAAAAYTKNLIGSQQVRLDSDADSTNRDRYNRLLRYIYLPDGRLVEAEIIKNGYGFAYTQFPFTKSAEFTNYQNDAHDALKGLWRNCNPHQEKNGRWQTEDLK